jgi:hypothetical protein
LSFSTSTGVISGTPTAVASATSITVQATNAGGSDTATISITVVDEAPSIAYSGSPFTFTKNSAISSLTPTNTGGAATSWSITSGTLPSGLSFSTSTGVISGTPTAVASATSITVQATNAGGSDTATISITVGFRIDLFVLTGWSNLSFSENSSDPLPSHCMLSGMNNSILSCDGPLIGGRSDSSDIIIVQTNNYGEESFLIIKNASGTPYFIMNPNIYTHRFLYVWTPDTYTPSHWEFEFGVQIETATPYLHPRSSGMADVWESTSLPPGLVMDSYGVVNGIPTEVGKYEVYINASNDNPNASLSRLVTINVISGLDQGAVPGLEEPGLRVGVVAVFVVLGTLVLGTLLIYKRRGDGSETPVCRFNDRVQLVQSNGKLWLRRSGIKDETTRDEWIKFLQHPAVQDKFRKGGYSNLDFPIELKRDRGRSDGDWRLLLKLDEGKTVIYTADYPFEGKYIEAADRGKIVLNFAELLLFSHEKDRQPIYTHFLHHKEKVRRLFEKLWEKSEGNGESRLSRELLDVAPLVMGETTPLKSGTLKKRWEDLQKVVFFGDINDVLKDYQKRAKEKLVNAHVYSASHNDMRAQNILVNANSDWVLCDFSDTVVLDDETHKPYGRLEKVGASQKPASRIIENHNDFDICPLKDIADLIGDVLFSLPRESEKAGARGAVLDARNKARDTWRKITLQEFKKEYDALVNWVVEDLPLLRGDLDLEPFKFHLRTLVFEKSLRVLAYADSDKEPLWEKIQHVFKHSVEIQEEVSVGLQITAKEQTET